MSPALAGGFLSTVPPGKSQPDTRTTHSLFFFLRLFIGVYQRYRKYTCHVSSSMNIYRLTQPVTRIKNQNVTSTQKYHLCPLSSLLRDATILTFKIFVSFCLIFIVPHLLYSNCFIELKILYTDEIYVRKERDVVFFLMKFKPNALVKAKQKQLQKKKKKKIAVKVSVGENKKVKVKVVLSCPTPWNSPGQNNGVGSHSLLQGIFPTQGLNPGLPHCRWILYQLKHQGMRQE